MMIKHLQFELPRVTRLFHSLKAQEHVEFHRQRGGELFSAPARSYRLVNVDVFSVLALRLREGPQHLLSRHD